MGCFPHPQRIYKSFTFLLPVFGKSAFAFGQSDGVNKLNLRTTPPRVTGLIQSAHRAERHAQPIPNMKTILALLLLASAAPAFSANEPGNFTVHEWGTFTSVQGGDGVPLRWQASQIGDLPRFVYDWFHPGLGRQAPSQLILGKGGLSGLQRMETPVIYFYSDKEITADVEVRFPNGLITEWYPQAGQLGPSSLKTNENPGLKKHTAKENLIHWQNVHVLPTPANSDAASLLPMHTNGAHYFAARETDSAYLRVNNLSPTNAADEFEKFLFYRGTGDFKTPLVVTTSDDGIVSVENTGATPLAHLFLLHVQDGRAEWAQLDGLAPQARQRWRRLNSVPVSERASLAQIQTQLGDAMAGALAGEGLFPAEARAMVKTWSNAWFTEEGVRVLYILPRGWTDEILPLKLKPQPQDLVRVMVGRAEVITPELQREIADQLKLANADDGPGKERLAGYWKKLGRFAGPAMQLANTLLERDQNKPVATQARN